MFYVQNIFMFSVSISICIWTHMTMVELPPKYEVMKQLV